MGMIQRASRSWRWEAGRTAGRLPYGFCLKKKKNGLRKAIWNRMGPRTPASNQQIKGVNRVQQTRDTTTRIWIAYVNSTWHAGKHRVHKLHRRYITEGARTDPSQPGNGPGSDLSWLKSVPWMYQCDVAIQLLARHLRALKTGKVRDSSSCLLSS